MSRIVPIMFVAALMMAVCTYAQPAPTAGPSVVEGVQKVAYANIGRIFNEMKEQQALAANAKKEVENLQKLAKEKEDNLSKMKQQRDMLLPGSQIYQDRTRELMDETIKFQNWLQINNLEIQRINKVQTKYLFEKIRTAVSDVATKRGIGMVLNINNQEITQEMIDQLNPDQLKQVAFLRTIVWAEGKADITQFVLAELDGGYTGPAAPKP